MHLPLRGALAPLTMPKGPVSLLSGLVSYWKLDEASGARSDSHGANHLTDNNTVTQAVGKVGNAAQFTDANSEWLSHVSNAELQSGDIDFTFSAWCYLDSLNNNRYVLNKWVLASQREYELVALSSNRFRFAIYNSAGAFNLVTATGLGLISTATWYFIVCWHDSVANTINIQGNNGVVDSFSTTIAPAIGTGDFQMGQQAGGAFWNGRIDEVGFWKRVLSAAERTALYNSGNGFAYPFS